MKSKVILLLSIVLISATLASDKVKVKVKKDIAYIDKEAYLDLTESIGSVCIYKSMNGKELVIVTKKQFSKPNPDKPNPHSSVPYSSIVEVKYFSLKFSDFDLEFEVDIKWRNTLIEAFYMHEIIDIEGAVSQEKAEEFARKYAQDVSGTRPY